MEEKANKTNKIGFRKYWFSVLFPKVLHDVWEYLKRDLANSLLIIVVAVIVSMLSANGILDQAISDGYLSDASSLIRMLVALLVLSVLYLLFSVFYYPIVLYNEQENNIAHLQKTIDELKEKSENSLGIVVAPNFEFDETGLDGKKRKYLTLQVYNQNKNKKIVEFGVRARLIFSHELDGNEIRNNALSSEKLLWLDDKRELIELRPDHDTSLIIAFLEEKQIGIRKIHYSGAHEVVFQLDLLFSGKYEGEDHFRNYWELRSFYSFPVKDRIKFTHFAVHDTKNISSKMIEVMTIMNNGDLYINN